jgi:chromosome segregation ATPase
MKDGALSAALRRLDMAMASVEAASARVLDQRSAEADHEGEIAMLAEDRSRLANEMDEISARAARLETTNRDVARRLETAIDTIRDVLAQADEEGGARG